MLETNDEWTVARRYMSLMTARISQSCTALNCSTFRLGP